MIKADFIGTVVLSVTLLMGLPGLAPVYAQNSDCQGTLKAGGEEGRNIAIFQGPGTGYKTSGTAASGEPMRLISTEVVKDTNGQNWAHVQLLSGSRVSGWVRYARIQQPCQVTFTKNYNPSQTYPTASTGETVPALKDLVGARAGQAEAEIRERGYVWRNGNQQADSAYSNWTESRTGNCVAIRTTNGRYASIVYAPTFDCNR